MKLIAHGDDDGVAVDADMGSTLTAERNTAIDGVEIVPAIFRVVENHCVAAVAPDLRERDTGCSRDNSHRQPCAADCKYHCRLRT